MTSSKNRRIWLAAVTLLLTVIMTAGAYAKTQKIEKVHPYYYAGRMRSDVRTGGTRIPAGAKVVVTEKNGSVYKVIYRNEAYKVPGSAVSLYDFVTRGNKRYSDRTAEAFVNGRGYSSSTDYLVWISTYTQQVYVFEGYRRHWELISHRICATGRFERPTISGVSKITYKLPWLWFNEEVGQGGYYGMNIRGGFIHSWLYNIRYEQATGRKLKWNGEHYGKPTSSGCVRVTLKYAKWMYETLPKNTTTVVY